MAMLCVRNTHIENIHAGLTPVTHTGDWSDVTMVDADGRRIPWTEVSHITDEDMRELMRQIVNRLCTFHLCAGRPKAAGRDREEDGRRREVGRAGNRPANDKTQELRKLSSGPMIVARRPASQVITG